ncbi:MAG: hypothetical protein JW993_10800 [Sedimentisphaerales bacterium]|nr:hypothetical protein [Sedimentisphaerales bacterium]
MPAQDPQRLDAGEAGRDRATEDGKNPAAVTLGRLGGLKGGNARAQKLSAQERQEIARKAAEARWRKEQGPDYTHDGPLT